MVKRMRVNGQRVKQLRTGGPAEVPQKALAPRCGMSERKLRRVENENLPITLAEAKAVARALNVGVEEILFSTPFAIVPSREAAADLVETGPGSVLYPRHTTIRLSPVAGAGALHDMAEAAMQIVPHVMVDAAPAQMAAIEECLSLLKAVSRRKWSCGDPVPRDAHDGVDFPGASRRRRLAELFVHLKGHDIRIVAASEIYRYPPGERPWTDDQDMCFQAVVGFAPPRGSTTKRTSLFPTTAGGTSCCPTSRFSS